MKRTPWLLAACAALLLAGALGAPWTLAPARGQTIPWPTDTPRRPTATPPPAHTWAPLPTWTLPPEAPAAPTATPPPDAAASPLVLVVVAQPGVAGPGDPVRFSARVANVSRASVSGVQLLALFPADLLPRSLDCSRCPASRQDGQVVFSLGTLPSGGQVLATVDAEVDPAAWPGQVLETAWQVTAPGVVAQSAAASVELPWAELPNTGGDWGPS